MKIFNTPVSYTHLIYADFGRSYAIVTLILLVSFAVVMVEMKVLKPKH